MSKTNFNILPLICSKHYESVIIYKHKRKLKGQSNYGQSRNTGNIGNKKIEKTQHKKNNKQTIPWKISWYPQIIYDILLDKKKYAYKDKDINFLLVSWKCFKIDKLLYKIWQLYIHIGNLRIISNNISDKCLSNKLHWPVCYRAIVIVYMVARFAISAYNH